ncbi:MAG: tetratricopeptide repeat protein [Phycisphaerae bacterium]|nr:tetratricopeptide repeat protein [Phycisphaerae bacterium]
MKNKISEQLTGPNRIGFLVFAVCVCVSLGYAETLAEDADPMDVLEMSLLTDLENVNIADIRFDKRSSVAGQKELISNIVANLAAGTDKDAKPSDLVSAVGSVSTLARQLWQAGAGLIRDDESAKDKDELQNLIEQINSVEFKSHQPLPPPVIVVEPAEKNETKESLPAQNLLQRTKYEKSAIIPQKSLDKEQQDGNRLPNKQITKKTMELFEQVSQQPRQIKSPLELAEVLFQGGQLKESVKCYRDALNQMSADANNSSGDKAWVLFQIGNCLQKDDPSAALQMYKQLIAECPDSLWIDLAKAKASLIDWYIKDKPEVLLEQYKSLSF